MSLSALIPAFVINLEKDRGRRDAVLRQFRELPEFEVAIVEGVYGSSLPDSVCEALAQQKRWSKYKGTIGCFLSHAKAWEQAAATSARFAVIVEDDVDLRRLKLLPGLAVPDDADIVFINDRMSPGDDPDSLAPLPMWCALRRLEAMHCGPGGDGYLLTPAGARKLLAACTKDYYFGHVDGRLLRYATTEQDLATLPDDSWITGVVRHHRHPTLIPALGLLRGYCVSTPLVKHLGVPSIREAEDSKPAEAAVRPPYSVGPAAGGLPIRYWTAVSNAGDQINPYVFETVAQRTPYFSPRKNSPHVLGIGSILFMATPESHIWGSGALDPKGDYGQLAIANVHAVRGKLTRDLLRDRYGLTRDVPLGDPGIFVDEIPEVAEFRRTAKPKRRIAVVPHHRMVDHPYIRDITRHPDSCVVDPRLDCMDFIREILSSEVIVSQSLHGLIFAQVFGKPFAWFSHTRDDTWLFKFRDWFSTSTDAPEQPALFGTPLETLLKTARQAPIAVDRAALRAAMPAIADDRRLGVGFRDVRRLSPLSFRVTHDAKAAVSSHYDATIVCGSGDEAALQASLHAQARRYDDSFPLVLVFDEELFAGIGIGEMRRYQAVLDALPDTHYLAVLPAADRAAGQGTAAVTVEGRQDLVEAAHLSYGWKGVVLVRNPYEFSFSARGMAQFRDAAAQGEPELRAAQAA